MPGLPANWYLSKQARPGIPFFVTQKLGRDFQPGWTMTDKLSR